MRWGASAVGPARKAAAALAHGRWGGAQRLVLVKGDGGAWLPAAGKCLMPDTSDWIAEVREVLIKASPSGCAADTTRIAESLVIDAAAMTKVRAYGHTATLFLRNVSVSVARELRAFTEGDVAVFEPGEEKEVQSTQDFGVRPYGVSLFVGGKLNPPRPLSDYAAGGGRWSIALTMAAGGEAWVGAEQLTTKRGFGAFDLPLGKLRAIASGRSSESESLHLQDNRVLDDLAPADWGAAEKHGVLFLSSFLESCRAQDLARELLALPWAQSRYSERRLVVQNRERGNLLFVPEETLRTPVDHLGGRCGIVPLQDVPVLQSVVEEVEQLTGCPHGGLLVEGNLYTSFQSKIEWHTDKERTDDSGREPVGGIWCVRLGETMQLQFDARDNRESKRLTSIDVPHGSAYAMSNYTASAQAGSQQRVLHRALFSTAPKPPKRKEAGSNTIVID